MVRILVVDDDSSIASNLVELLQKVGYSAEAVSRGEDAIERCAAQNYDVALVDLLLPDMDGIHVLEEIKRNSPKTVVIMITAFGTIPNAVEAVKKGASDYITKPFRVEELIVSIKKSLEESRMKTAISSDVLSCLSNEIRMKILLKLAEYGELKFADLVKSLKIRDPPKLSFHLKVLKNHGLVRQTASKTYRLTAEGFKVLRLVPGK